MINLIPKKAKKDLLIEYWIRVVSVWLILWSSALFIGAALLVPVYVLISSQITAYKESADEASAKVVTYEHVSSVLVRSSQQAGFLVDETNLPLFSEYISLFESLQGSEIVLNTINLTRSETGVEPVRITGVADNRRALASFRDQILAQESVLEVNLPIANLARDKDIPFTITVTLNKETTV